MIKSIFPIRYYQEQVQTKLDPNAIEQLKALLSQSIDNNLYLMMNGGVSSFHVDCGLQNAEYLKPIVKELEQHAQQAWTDLNYRKDVKAVITNMWVNGISKGGYLDEHHHLKEQLSGVYYIDLEPNTGNLVFHNPFDVNLRNSPVEPDPGNYRHIVNATTGDVVIFPGYLVHHTQRNTSDRLRLSLGFDVQYEFTHRQ